MAEPHFYLKDKNSSDVTLISLYWRIGSRRFVYSTGEKVRPGLWSLKKERVLPRHPDADAINAKLDRIMSSVKPEYQAILNDRGFVQPADLKAALDVVVGKEKGGTSLFEFFDQFIESKRESKRFSKASIGTYTSARSRLHEFARHKRMSEIDWQDINLNLWEELEDFIVSLGMSTNYTHKIMSRYKTVLKAAIKRGVYESTAFQSFDIRSRKEETTAIYLNKDELRRLYDLDYSGNKRLEKARDLFIVGAVTGLRYSDFTRISQRDIRIIDGMEFLDFLTKKTKKKVIIPVDAMLHGVLDKYGGKLPRLSQQRMNDYLKEIGEKCGFMDDMVNKVMTTGGQTRSEQVPRHSLFTTHTARRSFATNAYLDGWDLLSIMMITGHSSEKQLLSYIRVSKEENALRIAKANRSRQDDDLSRALDSLRWLADHKDRLGIGDKDSHVIQSLIKQLSPA